MDFENWAWAGQATEVSYALRYTSPEVRQTGRRAGRGGIRGGHGVRGTCSSALLGDCSRAPPVGVTTRAPPRGCCRCCRLQVLIADLTGEHSISADGGMDLFSLGVLAWEVLTGKRFYGGEGAGVGWGESGWLEELMWPAVSRNSGRFGFEPYLTLRARCR